MNNNNEIHKLNNTIFNNNNNINNDNVFNIENKIKEKNETSSSSSKNEKISMLFCTNLWEIID
jgi:hypothetical protein